MATLREFILNQSTLPTGELVRDHIQNPGTGDGGFVLIDTVEVDLVDCCVDVEVENGAIDVDVEAVTDVEVVEHTIDVEIDCNE